MAWLKQWCKAATQAEEQLKDWEAMREEIWPVDSNNHYAYLRLASFTDDVAALPPGEIPVRATLHPAKPVGTDGHKPNDAVKWICPLQCMAADSALYVGLMWPLLAGHGAAWAEGRWRWCLDA